MNRLTGFHLDLTPPPPLEYLIGPVEAAEFLRRDVQLVVCWAELGIIPVHKLRYDGREALRFRKSELAAWLKQAKREGGPKGLRQLTSDTRKFLGMTRKPASVRQKQKN